MILISKRVSVLCDAYLVSVLGIFNNSSIPGCLTWIRPYNHVTLPNPKHVSTFPSNVPIINSIFAKLTKKINKKPRQDED